MLILGALGIFLYSLLVIYFIAKSPTKKAEGASESPFSKANDSHTSDTKKGGGTDTDRIEKKLDEMSDRLGAKIDEAEQRKKGWPYGMWPFSHDFFKSPFFTETRTETYTTMRKTILVIKCRACGTKNRIEKEKKDIGRCAKCGIPFSKSETN